MYAEHRNIVDKGAIISHVVQSEQILLQELRVFQILAAEFSVSHNGDA